ncbi:MAG: PEP-CTERM sorting domain-containing protein [Phycisphaerae bacterium]|nr:PEP-CTERM sorting domain-containing protein [Phycisphaerae bacterium]
MSYLNKTRMFRKVEMLGLSWMVALCLAVAAMPAMADLTERIEPTVSDAGSYDLLSRSGLPGSGNGEFAPTMKPTKIVSTRSKNVFLEVPFRHDVSQSARQANPTAWDMVPWNEFNDSPSINNNHLVNRGKGKGHGHHHGGGGHHGGGHHHGDTPVPEPATLSLIAIGGLAVLFRRKRS